MHITVLCQILGRSIAAEFFLQFNQLALLKSSIFASFFKPYEVEGLQIFIPFIFIMCNLRYSIMYFYLLKIIDDLLDVLSLLLL